MIQTPDSFLTPVYQIESTFSFSFLSFDIPFIRFRFNSIKWVNIFRETIRCNFPREISLYSFARRVCTAARIVYIDRGGRSAMVSGYSTRLLHCSLHLPAWVGRTTGSEADSCYRVTRRIFRSKTPSSLEVSPFACC